MAGVRHLQQMSATPRGQYFDENVHRLEDALNKAVNSAINEQVDNPLQEIGISLLRQASAAAQVEPTLNVALPAQGLSPSERATLLKVIQQVATAGTKDPLCAIASGLQQADRAAQVLPQEVNEALPTQGLSKSERAALLKVTQQVASAGAKDPLHDIAHGTEIKDALVYISDASTAAVNARCDRTPVDDSIRVRDTSLVSGP